MRQATTVADDDNDADLCLFFTAVEVAQILRTTQKAVYVLAARGLVPVTRIGRRLLFPKAEPLDWLGQKSAPSSKGLGR